MEVLRPYSPEDDGGVPSPQVQVESQDGTLLMHWLNTRIRVFPGAEQFDHVEHKLEEERLIGFQNENLMKLLREHHFPELVLPYVDVATFNWLANGLAENLDDEIDGLEL